MWITWAGCGLSLRKSAMANPTQKFDNSALNRDAQSQILIGKQKFFIFIYSKFYSNGRAYFLCYIKGCTFKALITRADGRAYRLVDHNHEKRERKIGMQTQKMVAVKRQPMQENDQNNGNGLFFGLGKKYRYTYRRAQLC